MTTARPESCSAEATISGARRRAAINQHGHRFGLHEAVAGCGEMLYRARIPADSPQYIAFLDEEAHDIDRLVEKAAGIVAQIEDDAVEVIAHIAMRLLQEL